MTHQDIIKKYRIDNDNNKLRIRNCENIRDCSHALQSSIVAERQLFMHHLLN